MPWSKHPSVRDYIDAKKRGDTATTDQIVREVCDRFNTRRTDGSEAADLYHATTCPDPEHCNERD